MSLASACKLVVKGMRQFRQLGLRHKMVRNPAQMLDRAMIEEIPHPLPGPDCPQFLAQANVISKLLLDLIPFRTAMWTIDRPLCRRVRFGLIHQIRYPGCDGLDDDL